MPLKVKFHAHAHRTDVEKLIDAAAKGNVKKLKKLIEQGVDLNGQDSRVDRDTFSKRKRTALISAVINNKIDCVQALIAAHADPNIADCDGIAALDIAESRGYLVSAAVLKAAGAKRGPLRQQLDRISKLPPLTVQKMPPPDAFV